MASDEMSHEVNFFFFLAGWVFFCGLLHAGQSYN